MLIASSCALHSAVCFFFKQKTAYEMRISDWSSDVCSSDLHPPWFSPGRQVRSFRNILDFQARPSGDERIHIRKFFYDLVGWLARSMSRAGFDTDEVRLTPDFGMLQGGGIFEAVTGDDQVIRIRRDHHDRRIIQSAPDIVIRRIA